MRRRKLVATAGALSVTAFAATVAIGANFGLVGQAEPDSPVGRLDDRHRVAVVVAPATPAPRSAVTRRASAPRRRLTTPSSAPSGAAGSGAGERLQQRRRARAPAAPRPRPRSPVTGCANAEPPAWRNGRSSGRAPGAAAVARRRPPPDGRWPGGARGSGGCVRSRAGTRGAATSGSRYVATTSYAVRAARPPSRTDMRVGRRTDRPMGASITPRGDVGHAPHQRVVAPLDVVGGEHLDQPVVGGGRARDHEQPAGVAVEPVHDPGPRRIADVGDLGVAGEQPVDQRAVGVPGTRVHDQPRGLRPRPRGRRPRGAPPPRSTGRPRAGPPTAGSASTSTTLPASSLRLLGTRSPSTSTAPASTRSCTSLRVQPVSSATARSSRSPASASGTTSCSAIGARRRVRSRSLAAFAHDRRGSPRSR